MPDPCAHELTQHALQVVRAQPHHDPQVELVQHVPPGAAPYQGTAYNGSVVVGVGAGLYNYGPSLAKHSED